MLMIKIITRNIFAYFPCRAILSLFSLQDLLKNKFFRDVFRTNCPKRTRPVRLFTIKRELTGVPRCKLIFIPRIFPGDLDLFWTLLTCNSVVRCQSIQYRHQYYLNAGCFLNTGTQCVLERNHDSLI